jgi:hypothetical protein
MKRRDATQHDSNQIVWKRLKENQFDKQRVLYKQPVNKLADFHSHFFQIACWFVRFSLSSTLNERKKKKKNLVTKAFWATKAQRAFESQHSLEQ